MKFTTVKRAVKAVHVDGPDQNRTPEVEQVQGSVTFYPMMGDGDSVQVQTVEGPVTVVLTPITVRIADGLVMHRGGVGVQLFAGGKGSEPSLIRWRASFSNLQSDGVPLTLRDVVFDAVPDGEVDLTTAAPLANAPEPIVRGPQGVSMDSLTVEGGDLVVWGRSESGKQVLSRIKMSQITEPAAQAAADDTLAKLKTTLDGKADKSHKHTSADVTDATSVPTAGVLVKYDAKALFTVGAPTAAAHPATKQYVDDEVAKRALKQHTHPISDVTGLQREIDKLRHVAVDATLYSQDHNSYMNGYRSQAESALYRHGLSLGVDPALWAVALGLEAVATGPGAVAIGAWAISTALSSIAVGQVAQAAAENAVAIGMRSNATADSAVAIGADSEAAQSSLAAGYMAYARGDWSLALGYSAGAQGNDAVALGVGATATGEKSVAIGRDAKATKKDQIQLGTATSNVTVTGTLSTTAPKQPEHAATKRYVDDGLRGKSDSTHGHAISGINELQSALDDKAAKNHSHAWADITSKPSSFSPSSHSHAISDVTGLQSALNNKAASTHSHSVSQITGLAGEIAARPNAWIIETAAELKATEAKARAGDIIFVDETGEKWKVI